MEAHTPGQDDWVTLPDLERHTTPSTGLDAETGSCVSGWADPSSPDVMHPHLFQHQGADCGGSDFEADGWKAASGRSAGWVEWTGGPVRMGRQGRRGSRSPTRRTGRPRAWVCGSTTSTGRGPPGTPTSRAGCPAGSVGDPSAIGSGPNPLDWTDPPTEDVGFVEGAATSMDPPDADFRTLYVGFGFENVTGDDARNELMRLALDYLTS